MKEKREKREGRKEGRKEGREEGREGGREGGGKERYTGDTVPVSSPAAALPPALAQRRNINTSSAFLDARRAKGLALNPGPIVSPLSLFPEFPNRDTNIFAAYLRGFMGQKRVLPQSMSPWNL